MNYVSINYGLSILDIANSINDFDYNFEIISSKRKDLNIAFVNKYYNYFNYDSFQNICIHPNISLDFINSTFNIPGFHWDINIIFSERNDLTLEFIKKYIKKENSFRLAENPYVPFNIIQLYNNLYIYTSYISLWDISLSNRKDIPVNFLASNISKPWNWLLLSKNLSLEIIKNTYNNNNYKYDYITIIQRKDIKNEIKFILTLLLKNTNDFYCIDLENFIWNFNIPIDIYFSYYINLKKIYDSRIRKYSTFENIFRSCISIRSDLNTEIILKYPSINWDLKNIINFVNYTNISIEFILKYFIKENITENLNYRYFIGALNNRSDLNSNIIYTYKQYWNTDILSTFINLQVITQTASDINYNWNKISKRTDLNIKFVIDNIQYFNSDIIWENLSQNDSFKLSDIYKTFNLTNFNWDFSALLNLDFKYIIIPKYKLIDESKIKYLLSKYLILDLSRIIIEYIQ